MDFKALANRQNNEIDIILFITILILAGFGLAMVYSASAIYALNQFNDEYYFFKKQLIWLCTGFILLFITLNIDYHIYQKYTKIMLILSISSLILLLIPGIGHEVKGSSRWLGFENLNIQPSEFIKIFVVIYLAKVFSSVNNQKSNRILQLLIPILIISLIFLLILLQPDLGTAVILLIISAMILFVSGFSFSSIILVSLVSIPMFYLVIYQVEYRKQRIMAFFNPWKDRYGSGYHIIQSFLAFRKGGLLGQGLGLGSLKVNRLPEPHTDFIFAVIAEEIGLIGTGFILILYCILFWRGITVSFNAADEFGSILSFGLTILIVVQAFVNIGMVCGNLPTTGIPLPLISYGGSSFLSSMIALGILLNISKTCVFSKNTAGLSGDLSYE